MAHTLVEQLRFTRSQWLRGLQDVSAEDALLRHGRLNCISWMIGHLAWHEQFYWFQLARRRLPVPAVESCAFGQPASTPPLAEMWAAWRKITSEADPWLDSLDEAQLQKFLPEDKTRPENIGTCLLHLNYHYWYHLGEALAVRQLLEPDESARLPQFIGPLHETPWRPG